VLLTFEDYERLTGGQESIVDLLGLSPDEADVEFEITVSRDPARPADLT
jgi:hypothetical protein